MTEDFPPLPRGSDPDVPSKDAKPEISLKSIQVIAIAKANARDGRFTQVNRRFCEMVGYTEAELLGGMSVIDLTHPDDRQFNWALYNEVASGQAPSVQFEKRYIRKDGRVIWVEIDLMILKDSRLDVQMLSVVQDVTEKKQLLEEQHRRESELRIILDAMPTFAWLADGEGRIIWFNNRWLSFTGSSMDDVLDERWLRFIHPDEQALLYDFLRPAWAAGKPWEKTHRLRSQRGEYRWFLSRAVPLADNFGKTIRWVGTMADVTEHLEVQETLRQALSARDGFLSIASHELRTPLSSLQLQVQLLSYQAAKSEPVPTETLRKGLGLISRQANQLMDLVEEMFDVARIDSGKLDMHEETFDLGEVAIHAAEAMRARFEAQKVEFNVEAERELCVRGDRMRLEQVIANLLMNALKYGERSPVKLCVRLAEGKAQIVVRDHGPGIAAADQERIFRRFERAVSSTTASGLGLGLFISSEIVKAHRGDIRLRSEPGHGAIFEVHLPLARPSEF